MTGVIDVGSNSVRLLYNGKKYSHITQLSEGMMFTNTLSEIAMFRTAEAISELYNLAQNLGAEKVLVFGTEAVRSATNQAEFIKKLTDKKISIDILSSDMEAIVGFMGAYNGGIKAVLDVGGASSEIAVGDESGIKYTHSLPLGSVRLKDYSLDRDTLKSYIATRIPEYGIVPPFEELISIGGTSSSLVAVLLGLEPYNTDIVHNFILTYDDLNATVSRILSTPIIERVNIKGMHPKKTLLLPCGGLLISGIMEYLKIDRIRISERDNLEGYLKLTNNI